MKLELLFSGIGGQGVMLLGETLCAAAIRAGKKVTFSPFYGQEKRGGRTMCNIVVSDEMESPIISEAKVMLFMDERSLQDYEYMMAEDGVMILSSRQVKPVTASLGQSAYDGDDCLEWLKSKGSRCIVVNPEEIIEACGSPKVLNVAMAGALAATGAMDLSVEDMEEALRIRMKPALLEMNKKALHMGAQCAAER